MKHATQRFETHRARLLGLAYRMLGSRVDAEDVVQDAWFKWMCVEHRDIDNDEAFLTTIVTRLCLDQLKRHRTRRLAYTGPWLPDPLHVEDHSARAVEVADDVSFALMLALERLSPLERAAFLLHDVFDAPFDEVAGVLQRTEAAVRQLAARARRSLRDVKPVRRASTQAHQKLLYAFLSAQYAGDEERLKALLREDAMLVTDTGGHFPAAPKPIRGAHRIAHLMAVSRRKLSGNAAQFVSQQVRVNGSPGILVWRDGALDLLFTIDVEGEHIVRLYAQRNPAKLARIAASGLTREIDDPAARSRALPVAAM